MEDDDEAPVPLGTHVYNILHSIFSDVVVYINNHQIYKSNGMYAHKSYISNDVKGTISEYKVVLHSEGYEYEEFPDKIMESPSSDYFLTKRRKMLSRLDVFTLYGKSWDDFFTTSEIFYPNMKNRLRLIRANLNFYMISDNPNVCLGIVDCALYTRHIALKDDYHKLANNPMEFNFMETLAKTLIIPDKQNQSIQENIFNNAPVRRIAIAMNTKLCIYSILYWKFFLVTTIRSDKSEHSEVFNQ